jgi:YebC/PmpR family DNA-binding regulatory protein
MAGHSKWANIRHKKAKEDKKRGKIFSKYVKKITSAARRGGGDPDTNPELRLYIDKARDVNMPQDNIERAILKATGQLEGVSYEEFSYEGYGPGGIAMLLEGSTDNRNRTVAEIRNAFKKNGGNMGENGCVSWMFTMKGVLVISRDHIDDDDELMMLAIDHGADEIDTEGESVTLTCAPSDFEGLKAALEEAGHEEFVQDEITKLASNKVSPELSDARQTIRLIDYFEDHDDIENVYTNLELSDDVAEALEDE